MNKPQCILVVASLAAFPWASADAAPSSLNVHYQQYNNWTTYNASHFADDVVSRWYSGNFGNGDQKVVLEPSDSTYKRLRIQFDAGKYGSDHLIAGSWLAGRNNYTMEYRVRFANNWQFVKGGKLPGLTGGTHPSGGNPSRDGMSARIMWRDSGWWDGVPGGSKKKYLEIYHYWRGQALAFDGGDDDRKYGDRTYLQDATKNTWYKLKLRVNRGSGSSDGRLRVWVNGVKRHDRAYRYLDSNDNWKIDAVYHHFFYGGGDSSWAPSQTTHLFFDNLKIDDDWF